MSETEASGHYKHSYKSGPVLNYSVHLYPKDMGREEKRGRTGERYRMTTREKNGMKRR